jgi:L-histidine N-alpha-methyltransferase
MLDREAQKAMPTARDRYTLLAQSHEAFSDNFANDVRTGLTASPKYLLCRYLYDAQGSKLFEEICHLPEYYLTRTERHILADHADEIAQLFGEEVALVELGSGSASKTRLLIEALLRHRSKLRFVPVDISLSILEESSQALLEQYREVEIAAIVGQFHDGLARLNKIVACPKLLLFLGSSLGNFERQEAIRFLELVHEVMTEKDRLLIGIDLRKHPSILEPAYDDAQGVTARFNLNLLARINRELEGNFNLAGFRHRAVYNAEAGRMEMYLDSLCDQTVPIHRLALDVHFTEGEAIHTENSYKYSLAEIGALAEAAGFGIERQWLDAEKRFSVNICRPLPK